MKGLIVAIVVMLCLSACVLAQQRQQQEAQMNNLIGRLTVTQAISKLGAPSYERKEADGGTILIWTKTTTTSYQREAGLFERDFIGAFQPQHSQKVTEYQESKSQWILGFGPNELLRWWKAE